MPDEIIPGKIKCAKCGTAFECRANTHDCWCMSLPKVMPVEGESCWCPKCLEEEILKTKKSGDIKS